jgi:DNA polymerase III alpha subunit
MGLGQVRDLRRASIRSIVAERRDRPFESVSDLLHRVPLARKEWTHLIQSGALDGLGDSRTALLAEANAVHTAGDGGQLSFLFVAQAVNAEDPAQRLAWESRLLGMPVSVHPLDTVEAAQLPTTTLADLAQHTASSTTVAGVRLPGWTGGKGWFFGDAHNYVVAIPPKGMANPRPWRPVLLRGRWVGDQWGDRWLQVEEWRPLE